MTYQVLARKWRPQSFDAVVGQDAITRTLRNALVSGRIAHAYLFAGPRGVGKTTTARLLARALLCSQRTGAEPCGQCAVCVEAQAGTLVDIVEIDAASNRRIDDVRALRENVKYVPTRGRFKVYIIDEVHQLTPEAFDALLKTLEEPPPHVVFVLATTDPRDLPATILSRVQRFDFRPIPAEMLSGALERILTEEQIPFDAGALPVVVRAAEGSLRDALSLLDTAIAYGSGRLDAATVIDLLGATTPVEVQGFTAAMIGCDTVAALEAIDRAVRDGEDLQAFTRDVIELLRRVLVLKAAPSAKLVDVTAAEIDDLKRLGEPAGLDEILGVLRAFLEADTLMRDSPHPRVELEMAAVKATRRPVPHALEDIIRRIDEAEQRLRLQPAAAAPAVQESLLASPGPTATPAAPAPPARFTPPAARTAPAAMSRPAPASPPPSPMSPPAGPPPPASTMAPGDTDVGTAWARIVEDVMKKKPMVGSVLNQARPSAFSGGELTIVMGGNSFHRDLLADPSTRDLLLGIARRHLRGVERITSATGEGEGGDVRSHPAVQAAVEAFEGEVVAVRPRVTGGDSQ